MYDRVLTNIDTSVGMTESFPIKVRLHQGSVLWCMLFADDIILVAETKEEANSKLKEWREALEGKGLRISHTKTEYLRCNFCGTESIGEPEVTIGGKVSCMYVQVQIFGISDSE